MKARNSWAHQLHFVQILWQCHELREAQSVDKNSNSTLYTPEEHAPTTTTFFPTCADALSYCMECRTCPLKFCYRLVTGGSATADNSACTYHSWYFRHVGRPSSYAKSKDDMVDAKTTFAIPTPDCGNPFSIGFSLHTNHVRRCPYVKAH